MNKPSPISNSRVSKVSLGELLIIIASDDDIVSIAHCLSDPKKGLEIGIPNHTELKKRIENDPSLIFQLLPYAVVAQTISEVEFKGFVQIKQMPYLLRTIADLIEEQDKK